GIEHAEEASRLQRYYPVVAVQDPRGPPDLAVGHGADLAQLLGENQVWVEGLEELLVQVIDAATLVDRALHVVVDVAAAAPGMVDSASGHSRKAARFGR